MLFFYKKPYDYLKFTGNDRLDLINRLSSNEVKSLEKFKGIKTILTSDKARFLDLITLYNFGDFVFSTCSFNNSKSVITHLDKYTIMDDFKADNMSGTRETMLIFGNGAKNFVSEVFSIDTDGFTNNDFSIFIEEARHSMIARNDDAFEGYNFIYASKDKDFYLNKIIDQKIKVKYDISELRDSDYESRRIELGIPKFGNEMNENTNPLECGLTQYVSFTKGCYIGQEVISRLDTYDKISKYLVAIITYDKIPGSAHNDCPKLLVDNNECGYVTSSTHSEKSGYTGLGFIKTTMLDYSKEYKIKSNGNITNCKIKKLPFK